MDKELARTDKLEQRLVASIVFCFPHPLLKTRGVRMDRFDPIHIALDDFIAHESEPCAKRLAPSTRRSCGCHSSRQFGVFEKVEPLIRSKTLVHCRFPRDASEGLDDGRPANNVGGNLDVFSGQCLWIVDDLSGPESTVLDGEEWGAPISHGCSEHDSPVFPNIEGGEQLQETDISLGFVIPSMLTRLLPHSSCPCMENR
jgi:hypothetical protein